LTPEEYHCMRVECGQPAPFSEWTEDYTPLEVGLEWAVSDRKGCYTGQEVLARQVNYDKITRQLVGLTLQAGPPSAAQVQAEGKTIGVVTSSVISPRFGPIALAVLRRPYHAPGTAVLVGEAIPAVVSVLPFAL